MCFLSFFKIATSITTEIKNKQTNNSRVTKDPQVAWGVNEINKSNLVRIYGVLKGITNCDLELKGF
jgi:hypothetical protein